MSSEPMYDSVLLAAAHMAREADERANFCRICFGPLPECPGHVGYMEMFGPTPTDAEVAAYRADLEVRRRGLDRKQRALDEAARGLGYDGIDDLVKKVGP